MEREERELVYEKYIFSREGHIRTYNGKELKINREGVVHLYIDGKKKILCAARLMYKLFYNVNLSTSDVIEPIDGNPRNIALDNLRRRPRKTFLNNTLTPNEENEIVAIYLQRKRMGFKGEYAHPTYKELAEEYGCSMSKIYQLTRPYCTKRKRKEKV